MHAFTFDKYNEVGLNIGKLMRYCFKFDPKEVYKWGDESHNTFNK